MVELKKIGFEDSINQFLAYRARIESIDDLHHESELCYQLTSLYMGLRDFFGGDYKSIDYIDEKQQTVMRIVTAMIHDKLLEQERNKDKSESP